MKHLVYNGQPMFGGWDVGTFIHTYSYSEILTRMNPPSSPLHPLTLLFEGGTALGLGLSVFDAVLLWRGVSKFRNLIW